MSARSIATGTIGHIKALSGQHNALRSRTRRLPPATRLRRRPARPAPQPAVDRAEEHADDRPAQCVVPRQPIPDPPRQRQHPLPHRRVREDGLDQMRGLGIRSESAKQRTASEQQISAQLRDAQLASDQAFKQFSFSGLVHDSRDRRVRCSEVEAYVQDLASGGERKVPKSCDGSGTFAFSAPELQNDARIPIRLRVHIGQEKPYEFVVRLAEAQLAFHVAGHQ